VSRIIQEPNSANAHCCVLRAAEKLQRNPKRIDEESGIRVQEQKVLAAPKPSALVARGREPEIRVVLHDNQGKSLTVDPCE